MYELEGVHQGGCSVYSLNGFPAGEGKDPWSKKALEDLDKWLVAHKNSNRAYLLSINSYQLGAKKALEAAGFKVMGVCHTAHIDWDANAIAAWKKDFTAGKLNQDTIYLMGRGFWAVKRRKKGA